MTTLTLPKPLFDTCDETSLRLKWSKINITSNILEIKLQYKEIHELWEQSKECKISIDNDNEGVVLTETDVVDLIPGTPYYVRLIAITNDNNIITGPDTVFDTKPIDCTPKQKKCIIS